MAEKETWDLSREEIEERIRKSNEEWRKKGATRGGRSSGQGVKLLYIRDYLYHHATKEDGFPVPLDHKTLILTERV